MKFILICVCITISEARQNHDPFNNVINDVNNDVKIGLFSDSSIIRELIQRVELLEARDTSYAQEIVELKQEMSNQKNEMAALRKKIFKQDRQISRLMLRLLLCERIPSTSPNKDKADADLTTTENKENRIRRQAIVAVAFSVGLTHSIHHMSGPRNIAFDHVETNIGNGYNSINGVFTAPVSGTYVFYTSVLAFNDDELRCQLVVNGQNKAHVYARGTNGLHDQGGQSIIVQLQVGDYVAVQNSAYDDSIYGDIYSTFSGFLLQLDYTQPGAIVG